MTEPSAASLDTPDSVPALATRLAALRWSHDGDAAGAAKKGDSKAFAHAIGLDLRKRFGGKSSDVERCVARFPGFESVARAVYRRLLDPSVAAGHLNGDVEARLARTAALLDGLRRCGSRLDAADLPALWLEGWSDVERITTENAEHDSPVANVLAAEAQWAGGILYEGLSRSQKSRKAGRDRLRAELETRTDTDGTPHADLLPVLPEWFGSLVRCLGWAKAGGEQLWNDEMSERFDGLLRAVTVLTRADGHVSFSRPVDLRELLVEGEKRASGTAGTPVARLIARMRHHADLPAVPVDGEKTSPHRSDRVSPPVVQSDWGKLAVCRSRWRREADLVAVQHAAATPSLEFSAFGRLVIAGEWGLRLRLDGADVAMTPEWEAVTWFSDKDADYLELEWPNEQGLTVCRQVLLTRADHQLVLADAVSCPGRPDAKIEVESTLPPAAGVTTEFRRPLREIVLNANGLSVRCLPVALPMNRIEQAAGSLEPDDGRLVVRQSGIGGVYLPLVFDWNPCRRGEAVEWRTLTVTENHRRLGPAEASGHRLRIGDRQLLVYRRLNGSKAMRCVLGYHHGSESVIGRFTRRGDVDPLVIVE